MPTDSICNHSLHGRRHLFVRLTESISHSRARVYHSLHIANGLEEDRVGHSDGLEDDNDNESRLDSSSVLDDAVHDKREESRAGATHGDKGGSTLGASALAAKANSENEGIYGTLEEVEEDNRDNKKVGVGWADNHRKQGEEETPSDAGGENGARPGEAGAVYGKVCEACCHEARNRKGGMRNKEVIGYREADAGRFVGVGVVAGTLRGILAASRVVRKYGDHEASKIDAETLLGSNVGVLSKDSQN